jgi:hypothetical protein
VNINQQPPHQLRTVSILLLLLLLNPTAGWAQATDACETWNANPTGVILRAGYVIGGTSPVPLPHEIRSIHSYRPVGGVTAGCDVFHFFNRRWGLQVGWHFFYEGFHTRAEVKSYRIAITQGENFLEGRFTGTDETDTWMLGNTIPLTAVCRLSPRLSLSAGPFISLLYTGRFEGCVYDGYLREGDPTGQKVEITRENPATYDFRDDMLHTYWGLQLQTDWQATRHIGLFAGVDWGLSSIFPSSFQTMEFKMFPIYAKLGVSFKF